MKKLLLAAFLVFGVYTAKAQQDALLSQYMFNHLLINPAYAGSKDYMMATLLYRNQWVNWKGAPTTEVASLHGPIGTTNLGWGGLIAHDHEGVTDRTDFYGNFSYFVRVNEQVKLGMGLRAGAAYYVRHNSDLVYWDTNDPKFAGDQVSSLLPNFGTGLYLYGDMFYLGASIPELLSYDPNKSLSVNVKDKVVPEQVRHIFATAGYVYPINEDVILKPSLLVKYVGNAPTELDININALLNNIIWVGASYRTSDAVVAIVEFQLNKKLRIGYSYDFTMTDIKDYSAGSHEIMLGYDFGQDFMMTKTPRYF
jgi:type IX secretion system PorP/SprF family membrane protein